jgi:prophage regulatory protein
MKTHSVSPDIDRAVPAVEADGVRPRGGTIWRKPRVLQETGLSNTTQWRLENAGKFPARVQLSKNCVGWYEDEVEQWKADRRRLNKSGAQKAR